MNILNLFKNSFLAKTIIILAVMLTGGGNFVWADEITINDGTTTDALVPIAGSAANKNPKQPESEFIVSSTSISSLGGKEITKLTFYLETSATVENWGTAEFEVLLKEVSNEYYPSEYSYLGTDGTIVYSGQLDATGSTMDIQFSTPFTYSGDNHLLIRINCTKSGTSSSVKFYGIKPDTKNIRALYKSGSAAYRSFFNPKTTFTYQDAASGGTPKPTNFAASDVTYNSATLSWKENGEATKWQIKYKTDSDFANLNSSTEGDSIIVNATDGGYSVSEGVSSYTFTPPYDGKTYYAYIRAYIDEDTQSDWSSKITFATPEQYPTPTGLTASNYAGDGDKATLSWINGVGTAASKWQIRYSTSSTFNPEEAEVTLVNNVSTNPYTLTGLTANTTYYACVRADYSDNTENHYSDWTETISFTPIEAWEDFSNGIPETWYNSGFVTNRSGYEGQAFSSSSSNVLRTPRLYANKDDQLNFYVTLGGGSITARYYKNSRSSYTTIPSYSTGGEKTFTAPSDGYYWIEFTNAFNGAVDNISGFSIADKENLMELGSKTMSSTGTVGGDYTASVMLRELGGNNETYTAQLYYDEEVVAEKVGETINGNRDETVSLTFTPSVAKTSKPMYIKIIYNNGESVLTTGITNVTMSNTTIIFDEKGTTDNKPTSYGTIQVLLIKYVAQTGWNTICVPFVLNDTYLTQIFGSDYRVYKINSFSDNGLSFSKTTSYSVSTPYLIYAPNTTEVAENINLKGVYYNPTNLTSENRIQTKGTGTTASFIGTFAPIAASGMEGKYGVTTAGKLGKGNSSASIKGYRAYVEVSNPSLSRLSIIIDDDKENQTTDLGFVKLIDKDAKDVYNLQGQKVKKATKGIYIVNGRKVIIK